jgi:hypothetical protein
VRINLRERVKRPRLRPYKKLPISVKTVLPFSGPGPEHHCAEFLRLPAPVRTLPLLLRLLRVPEPVDDPPQRGHHRRPPTQQVLDVRLDFVLPFLMCRFQCRDGSGSVIFGALASLLMLENNS